LKSDNTTCTTVDPCPCNTDGICACSSGYGGEKCNVQIHSSSPGKSHFLCNFFFNLTYDPTIRGIEKLHYFPKTKIPYYLGCSLHILSDLDLDAPCGKISACQKIRKSSQTHKRPALV
jgi:hypothetical protein